jgi:hypothetical protein
MSRYHNEHLRRELTQFPQEGTEPRDSPQPLYRWVEIRWTHRLWNNSNDNYLSASGLRQWLTEMERAAKRAGAVYTRYQLVHETEEGGTLDSTYLICEGWCPETEAQVARRLSAQGHIRRREAEKFAAELLYFRRPEAREALLALLADPETADWSEGAFRATLQAYLEQVPAYAALPETLEEPA